MSFNPFQALEATVRDKNPVILEDQDFERDFSPYMMARILSMRKDLAPYADIINAYSKHLTKENVCRMMLVGVPQRENVFVHYIKKEKVNEKKNKEDEE